MLAARTGYGEGGEVLTHYQQLGVPPAATDTEVRAAFLNLSKQHHPDTGAQRDVERYKAITEAWAVLKHPASRAEYDKRLRLTMPVCKSCNGAGRQYITMTFNKQRAVVCPECAGAGYLDLPAQNPSPITL